jgi:hypothetical protein
MTQPSILLYGNCQSEHLAYLGRFLPSLRDVVNFKVIPLHIVTADDWLGRFGDSFMSDVAVLWDQVETGEPNEHRRAMYERIRPNWQVVKYPPYSMLALWPFAGNEPRLAEIHPYRYPWTDSVAASVARENPSDDSTAFDRYMQITTERMPDLQRRLRMDVGRWRAADEISDIQSTDWVVENFRTRQVFYTAGHLTALPLVRIMKLLLERTGILTAAQIRQANLEIDLLSRYHRGQDLEVVPVHPVVAERFGLSYYDPEARHRWHGHEWTFREYILKYIHWAPFLD